MEKTILIDDDSYKYRELYWKREDILKKYENITPHQLLNNYETLKWLNGKVSNNVKYRSILSLLPQNGISEGPLEHKIEELIERKKVNDKYKDKFLEIKTKYLFSLFMNDKLDKLKTLFLEFDEDGSRKLELNELTKMFELNSICVSMIDLHGLFFKNKKFNKDAYLNFYDFKNFALSEKKDQEFRDFMRSLKEKFDEDKRKKEEKAKEELKKNKYRLNTEFKEENIDFLPMNFNLLLDYFNKRGKLREYMSSIKECIKKLEIHTKYYKEEKIKKEKKEVKTLNNTLIDRVETTRSIKRLATSNSEILFSDIPINLDKDKQLKNQRRNSCFNYSVSNGHIFSLYETQLLKEEAECFNEEINIEEILVYFEKLFNQKIPKENKQDINYLLSLKHDRFHNKKIKLEIVRLFKNETKVNLPIVNERNNINTINSRKFCEYLFTSESGVSGLNERSEMNKNYYNSFRESIINYDHLTTSNQISNDNLSNKEFYFNKYCKPSVNKYIESGKKVDKMILKLKSIQKIDKNNEILKPLNRKSNNTEFSKLYLNIHSKTHSKNINVASKNSSISTNFLYSKTGMNTVLKSSRLSLLPKLKIK